MIRLLNIFWLWEEKKEDRGLHEKHWRKVFKRGWHWNDTSFKFCSPDGGTPAQQDYLWDEWAKDLRAMSLLNNRAQSHSITVNSQSIRWPTTHEWNLAAFTDASILKKKKILHCYRFSLVLRLVNSINNFQQHLQRIYKVEWLLCEFSPFFFLTFCQSGCNFFPLFSIFLFTAFLQFCSRQSLAMLQLYCTLSLHLKMRWNHRLKVGSRWDMACMLMTAQGGHNTPAELGAKLPCQCELQEQQFAESSRGSPCNHFSLYSADGKVTKNNFSWSRELMHLKGSGFWWGCVGGKRWCSSTRTHQSKEAALLQSPHSYFYWNPCWETVIYFSFNTKKLFWRAGF